MVFPFLFCDWNILWKESKNYCAILYHTIWWSSIVLHQYPKIYMDYNTTTETASITITTMTEGSLSTPPMIIMGELGGKDADSSFTRIILMNS